MLVVYHYRCSWPCASLSTVIPCFLFLFLWFYRFCVTALSYVPIVTECAEIVIDAHANVSRNTICRAFCCIFRFITSFLSTRAIATPCLPIIATTRDWSGHTNRYIVWVFQYVGKVGSFKSMKWVHDAVDGL